MRPTRIAVFNDVHVPYHDERALALVCKILDAWRPDRVVLNGDFMDCYKLSVFDHSPDRILSFEDEVKIGNKELRKIEDAAPSAQRYFLEGNHEYRLSKYLMSKAPELWSFVNWPRLLDLQGRWRWIRFGGDVRLDNINFTHCVNPRTTGENAHMKARDTYEGNASIGHVHWLGINYRGNAKGEQHVGATFGWLGDYKQADYLHRIEALRWTQGMGIGHVVDGVTHLQPIPFIKGVAVIDGKVFRA